MTIQTFNTAVHVAHLDPMLGIGTLTLPSLVDDLRLPATLGSIESNGETLPVVLRTSLNDSDWNAMLRMLGLMGWQPIEGDEGPVHIGYNVHMNAVIGLASSDPIVSEPTIDELHDGWTRLHDVAQVVLAQ